MNIYFTKEIKTLHFMLSQKEELWLKYLNMKAPLHIFQRIARNKVICQINVFHNNPSGGSQMNNTHTGRIHPLLYNSNPRGRVMADMHALPSDHTKDTNSGQQISGPCKSVG